jgi:transposase
MKAYSLDLRQKILEAYDGGRGTQEKVAELFGVSRATVQNFLRRRRETGSVAASPHGGGRRPLLDDRSKSLISDLVRDQPDATLEELCDEVAEQTGIRVSIATMWLTLKRIGLPLKKSHSMRMSETRPE